MAEPHPLYLDTDPSRRAVQAVRYLYDKLHREALDDMGEMAWRVLEDGTVFGLMARKEDSRQVIRIAHPDPTDDATSQAEWEDRVHGICRELCIDIVHGDRPCVLTGNQWIETKPPERDQGKTVVWLTELRRGEVKPKVAFCWPCFEAGVQVEVTWSPSFDLRGQRCHKCKTKPNTESRPDRSQSEMAI